MRFTISTYASTALFTPQTAKQSMLYSITYFKKTIHFHMCITNQPSLSLFLSVLKWHNDLCSWFKVNVCMTYRWAHWPNIYLLTSWKMDSPWTESCIWCCCSLERRCSRFADWRHIVIISVHANILKRALREFRKKIMHLMTPIAIYADLGAD